MQRPRINLTSTPSDAQMPEIGTTATWIPTKTCHNMWFTPLSACVKLQAYRETCGLRITIFRTLGPLSNTGVSIVVCASGVCGVIAGWPVFDGKNRTNAGSYVVSGSQRPRRQQHITPRRLEGHLFSKIVFPRNGCTMHARGPGGSPLTGRDD